MAQRKILMLRSAAKGLGGASRPAFAEAKPLRLRAGRSTHNGDLALQKGSLGDLRLRLLRQHAAVLLGVLRLQGGADLARLVAGGQRAGEHAVEGALVAELGAAELRLQPAEGLREAVLEVAPLPFGGLQIGRAHV